MRAAVAAVLLIGGCASPSSPGSPVALSGPAPGQAADAAAPDQAWAGTISCDPIPGVVTKVLVQRFRLDVRGGVAHYERAILLPDTPIESGDRERGEGAVAPNGNLMLNGHGARASSSYDAEYSGTLAPDGRTARLTGVQHWRFSHRPSNDRACQITLRRQG